VKPEAPEPEPEPTEEIPADIFNKPKSSQPTENNHPEETQEEIIVPTSNPPHSSKSVMIIITIGLIGITAGTVYAYMQGLLNPIFEWILSTIGI